MPTSWFILLPHYDWQVLGSWSYCFPSGISTSSAGSQVVLPVPDFPFFRSLFILQSTATLVILRSSFRMLLLCSKTVSGSMCPSTPVQTRLSGFSVSISGFILSCSLPLVPLTWPHTGLIAISFEGISCCSPPSLLGSVPRFTECSKSSLLHCMAFPAHSCHL